MSVLRITCGLPVTGAGQTVSVAEELTVKQRMARNGLVRPRSGRFLAGVCAGLARRFGMKPGVVRLLFVLSLLLPGPQVLAYIALWIIMPSE
jgi:phage shock protein PspC (stress-responsive transcriptional regulator)